MRTVGLLVFCAVAWATLVVSACCHPSTVERPVAISPPACRERDHPEPPVGAVFGDEAWSRWFVSLTAFVLEVEHACPKRVRPAPARPDPGPAWWTRQPSGAGHGE